MRPAVGRDSSRHRAEPKAPVGINPDLQAWPAEAGPTAPVPVARLALAWLALSALTLIGLGLGTWFHGRSWLPLLVAGMIWLKGALVARHFLEASHAHPFIRRVLLAFIAFAPLMLLLTSFLGEHLARWTSL